MSNRKTNPTQGFEGGDSKSNPFYRDHEDTFKGKDLELESPVRSIGMDGQYNRKGGTNVMDDVLREQAPRESKKTESKGAKS